MFQPNDPLRALGSALLAIQDHKFLPGSGVRRLSTKGVLDWDDRMAVTGFKSQEFHVSWVEDESRIPEGTKTVMEIANINRDNWIKAKLSFKVHEVS